MCTQLIKSLPKAGKQEFCVEAFVDAGWVIQEHELEVHKILWSHQKYTTSYNVIAI